MTSRAFPGLWGRLLPFIRPYWPLILGAIAAIVLTSVSTLASISVARQAAETFSNLTLERLNALVIALIAVYTGKSLFTWLANLASASMALHAIADLRAALFARLQAQSLDYFERRASGDLSARLVNDVNLLKDALVIATAELVPSLIIVTCAIGYLFVLNWHLAALAVLGMPLVGWAIGLFANRLRDWSSMSQGRVGDMLAYLNERLSNVLLVKSFGQERHEAARFAAFNHDHLLATLRGAQVQALQTPVVGFLQILAIGGVFWMGGWEILNNQLTVPDLLAFAAAVGVCIDPVLVVSNAVGKIQQAAGALDRIFEVMDTPAALEDGPDARTLPHLHGHIAFDRVVFGYEGKQPVLSSLELTVAAGSVVALVGPSGSGKTTVTKLLQRFYDPQEGRVTLDGVDLRELRSDWLRQQVGYVSQESSLFSGTIADNIRYGKLDASEAEVEAAARAANAHGFITGFPDAYETRVGERGASLSGGQRQRIAIARALLRDPRLLILDEATSALDTESEAQVQEALERLMQGRTTLIVAHRLSTIQKADRIVTLSEGQVLEQGTHVDLLAQGGLYSKWYEHQTSAR
ncbi:ABC transporter ATP-binding protein [bacterium]|nr:ABC transporter ATP-binding protein [bacterium]